MVWFIQDDQFALAVREIEESKSHRAIAILCGALVERELEKSIKKCFCDDDEAQNEMFRPSGPLGSFSSKISLGFLMGLYGKKLHRDLKTIKDIRNAFAHNLSISSFNHQKISALTKNIEIDSRFRVQIRHAERKDRKKFRAVYFPEDLDAQSPDFSQQKFVQSCKMIGVLFSMVVKGARRRPHPYAK